MLQHLREVPIKTRQNSHSGSKNCGFDLQENAYQLYYRHCYHLQVKVALQAPCVSRY